MASAIARQLIWVPIIHSQEDMGRLRESVREQHTQRHGDAHWDRHVEAVRDLWRRIREQVAALGLEPQRTRLYQDGLPVCAQVGAIVADLARAGSENHRLLADLAEAGATIEGTESPELLLLEYQLARRTLEAAGTAVTPEVQAELAGVGRELLARRDRFIADRIDQTLQPGETGLLFLGMLHGLGPYLSPDLHVERMDTTGPSRPKSAERSHRTSHHKQES